MNHTPGASCCRHTQLHQCAGAAPQHRGLAMQDADRAVCAAHPYLPLIAVSTGDGELLLYDAASWQKLRADACVGCLQLAWHPRRPSVAVLRRSTLQIFSSERTDDFHFRSYTVTLPCSASAVCWARTQLLLGGEKLCACSLDARFSCIGEPEVQPVDDPIVELQMEPSERWAASVHRSGWLLVWWAEEKASGSRRQPLMGCCTEALEKDCVAARWAPRRRCPPCAALLAAQNQHGTVTVWRESSFDEGCCLVAEARWSIPGFNALSWVVPADWECDSEDVDWWEDKVPLRPTQHGVAANTALSASLVVLGVDGLTLFSLESANAALPLQCRRRQIAGCPSVAMPSLCSSQTFSVGGGFPNY
ncbi:unnamed protein product [Durusdinium trenchii]|uniref:Uncharacterized protein n=1 Tax=Durusdinium trenchii TaxID=1381693 RepID=A0ABP0HQ55_9DINO